VVNTRDVAISQKHIGVRRIPMRILINAFSARLGGGQTYLLNLLKHLPASTPLELLVYAPETLALPEDPRIKRLTSRWPTTNPLLRSLWERFMLPGILRKHKADVLFCPGGVLATRPPAGCRSVTMFRNMLPFDMAARKAMPLGLQRTRTWMLEHVMLRSMASVNLVIFISEFARQLIESKIRVKHAVTIPHGIPEAFKSMASNASRPAFLPSGNYLLYVSRFDYYKHHYEVVRAYGNLPPDVRQSYKLLLIGESDMPEGERVRALVAKLGLTEDVVILGAVKYSELPAAYKHATLTLFASSCENCPNILLEALGAGRPVLSSNIPPMPEFGGDSVVYFDPLNPDDLSAAIQKVLASPALAAELGRKAAERSARYDWSKTAEETWRQIQAI
jgi:glycosyltransferase involved in cell wall biosynthesis